MQKPRLDKLQTRSTMTYMQETVDFLKKRPRATYSLQDAEALNLIPWAKSAKTIRKLIDADFEGENLLGVIVTGSVTQRRYLLTASGIIRYLKAYGPAMMAMARKPNRHGSKKGNKRRKSRSEVR